MQRARYAFDPEGLRTLVAIARDRRRVARSGIPRLDGATPRAIAAAALRHNLRDATLAAGAGHFRAMWTADTGKAFGGALLALPRDPLEAMVDRMVRESARLGRVPTAWTPRRHHELPWPRADNAPWLLRMAALLGNAFVAPRARELDAIYARWFEAHVDARTGLVRREVVGDWMDTIPRPSSTYNNLCAIHAFGLAERLGFRSAPAPAREATQALLDERWTGTHLRAHAGAGDELAADAVVPALYLDVLPAWAQRRAAATLTSSTLVAPVPLATREGRPAPRELPPLTRLAAGYHATVWTHLGLMMCVGLRRLGEPWEAHAAAIERTVTEHATFLETLDRAGRPYVRRFLATEYHFTMSAGLYLELVG